MKDHAGTTSVRFLAELDPDAGAAVRDRFEAVSVAGGRVLFEQGDPPDALYVLVSGALGVSVRDMATGAMRRIARVAPPDTVGEMALLSDVPHSATVTALRDAHLLRLSREAFADVLLRHPTTALYFARLLADRLRANGRTPRHVAPSPTTFAAIAVTDGVGAGEFGRRLAASLGSTSACLDQWPVDADETWFHRLEDRHAAVVYAGDVDDPSWTKLCLRRADHVILLAQADAPLAAGADKLIPSSEWTRTDLIVLQDDGALLPRGAHPSLDRLGAALTTHVRAGVGRDVRRAARLASGASLGIVLSGGGARGFAHLGVLRALREAGLEFDLLGGTSNGAVVAAGHALGWDDGELRERIVDAFVSNQPLNDYTLPLVALTRGGKVDARLARHFGDTLIENLWTPYFCVSSNLSTGTATYHRSGRLATALRASVAIPGLLPPVLADEGVLADGAMMNNLPADVMADMNRGRVFAVDVAGDLAFQHAPGRRRLLSRWVRSVLGVPDEMPGIASLLLRAGTVSSDAQAAMARARASVVIRPPLAGIDLKDWKAHEDIAAIGYEHTSRLIDIGVIERALVDAGQDYQI